MAIINRKSGMVSGKIGNEVFYGWHGLQCVRKESKPYTYKNSLKLQNNKIWMAEASACWRALPDELKNMWEHYAKTLGSASKVEANDNVSNRYCPIRNYPPRPKLMYGENAFAACHIIARRCGMENWRVIAPIGPSPSPSPSISQVYDREKGELVLTIHTPDLTLDKRLSDRKAILWANFSHCNKKVYHHKILDIFDIPAKPSKIERRYTGLDETDKDWGRKPLAFKDVDYLIANIAAQIVTAAGADIGPIVSACSNILHFHMLNDQRLYDIRDLIALRKIVSLGKIKFGEGFDRYVAKIRSKKFGNVK